MADDDLFGAPVGGGDEDIFGAAVEDVDASEIAGGGDDDMFGAAVDVEEVNADVTATDDVDDMFGAPAAVDEQPAYDIQADPTPEPEAVAEPEPEPVQQESARIVWSRKFRAIIDERAAEERKLLLARREEHKSSTAARNRQEEADFLINIAEEKDNDNPWSRVVNMIETQASADENRTDPKRLRSVLIQLKNKPLKQAAKPADDGGDVTM